MMKILSKKLGKIVLLQKLFHLIVNYLLAHLLPIIFTLVLQRLCFLISGDTQRSMTGTSGQYAHTVP